MVVMMFWSLVLNHHHLLCFACDDGGDARDDVRVCGDVLDVQRLQR